MDRAIIMVRDMQYVMGRANAKCDANTLWAARMRYAECDTRCANKLWAARMRYAICKCATRYEQLQGGLILEKIKV